MENSSVPQNPTLNLGDVVALSSHPFSFSQQNIFIGGESQFTSPMMVIVEISRDLQDIHDENTGVNLQLKGKTSQCKCIWYSSKSFQFEEVWLSSKLLKLILTPQDTVIKKLEIGTLVTLCTAKLELKKLKSSYKFEGDRERPSINPLLSFVSPIMQIIGTAKNENKEPIFDAKTGNKKKEISKLLVKCKWFNPSSEKMSEKLLPIEALSLIPAINEVLINAINGYIENGEIITFKINDRQTLIRPHKIKYTHGYYHIVGYDYVLNRMKDFAVQKLQDIKIEQLFSKKAPNFDDHDLRKETHSEQYQILINAAVKAKSYIRIKYEDRYHNITFRTLKDFKIVVETDMTYLSGHCKLRNAERHFQLDRIQFLEVLNLKY